MSKRADHAFTTNGFSNWKKAVTKFKEHEQSLAHKDAITAFKAMNSQSISSQLQRSLDDVQSKHRRSLVHQIKCIRYLLRQGIAVRNDHSGGSNLTEMLRLLCSESAWIAEGKYQSPEIINEIIRIMGNKVLRSLLLNIQNQKFFSLMADETRDVSNREQLVVCLRWVGEDYEVHEDMVGLTQLANTTANVIYENLKLCLLQFGIPLENCRGQAHDGASSFQGHVRGVAKRIQEDHPSAISVHCLAHCLNLTLQDLTRKVKPVKDALSFAMDVIQLIKYSPKRQVMMESIQSQLDSSTTSGIRTLCPTRWTVRTSAFQSILINYHVLRETFEQSSHGSDECSRRANGVLALMDKFSTYFGVKLSILIFSITEQMSLTLQHRDTSVQDGHNVAEITIKHLERLRNDEKFNAFFSDVKSESANHCDSPVLPRQRQLPKRVDDGLARSHVFSSVEDYYRKQYYEAIDLVKGDLERRFTQKNFLIVKQIEKMLINASNGTDFDVPQELCDLYQRDVDFLKLKLHLQMLPDVVQSTSQNGISLKEVTSIVTICDLFNQNNTAPFRST